MQEPQGRLSRRPEHRIFRNILSLVALILVFALFSCGRPQSSLQSQSPRTGIVDGEVSSGNEQWAHSIVGIGQRHKDGTFEIDCTGTLIEPTLVITAAHCLHDPAKDIFVIFGLNDDAPIAIRETVKTALHEKYDRNSTNEEKKDIFDIGLIRFKDAPPAGYVPIPILNDYSLLRNGMQVTIAGFGQTDAKKDASSGILHHTKITLTDVNYSPTEIYGDESKSAACFGDSGGPLMTEVNGRFVIWGTISRGDSDCKSYGIYTRIDVYRNWIITHE